MALARRQRRAQLGFATGLLVAVLLLAAETSAAELLSGVSSTQVLTSVFVPGILLIAALAGVGLGVLTAIASAVAAGLVLATQAGSPHAASGFPATLGIFVLVSLLAGALPRLNGAEREDYDELCRIADEQAALRNLATFVAHNVPPSEVFDAVARELAQILGTKHTVIARYEPDGTSVVVTGTWNYEQITPSGTRWKLEKGTVAELVFRTRQPSRVEGYASAGRLTTRLCQLGVRSSVGCPIVVGCDLWGVAIASSTTPEGLPADTEERMLHFTELAGAAIANAQSASDLIASQARIVTAADETRRRIGRDLRDGAQQDLVSIELRLRAVEAALPAEMRQFRHRLSDIAQAVDDTLGELQEISRGLSPRILAEGGLEPALRALAGRSTLPVRLTMSVERPLPGRLETTVYYVVAEALTNVARHAHASAVFVDLTVQEALTRLTVRDDGIGGADARRGSGLTALTDRVSAFGGRLDLISPMRGGTTLRVQIPHEDTR